MKLYRYEATKSLITDGYVVALDEDAARTDAFDSASETDYWEPDYDIEVYLNEVDPAKVPSRSIIWYGEKDISIEQVIELLDGENGNRLLPEIPGQEQFPIVDA